SGSDERRLRADALSIKPLLGVDKVDLGEYIGNTRRAVAAEPDQFDDVQFHLLIGAYLAARQGDQRTATEVLASIDPKTNDVNAYPMLHRMRTVAEAELARAGGHPDQAIAKLKSLLDGRELYVTHVALMDAYSASKNAAAALEEARWLAAHRGRAYTEY